MLRGQCQPGRARGTVHVCVGHAGAAFYDNGADPRPAWIEHEAQTTHGHARLHTSGGKRLTIEAVDTSGAVFDSVVLLPRRQTATARRAAVATA